MIKIKYAVWHDVDNTACNDLETYETKEAAQADARGRREYDREHHGDSGDFIAYIAEVIETMPNFEEEE